ncbi:MAG: tetratricopeptide repeat protein, partial [Chloroflexia bacterium]|nr:tetratricopeptide repeat protein [Chloroflexia bacterium]
MPRLQITLLGAFQVTLDEEPLTGFATDKVRALLAYLAVQSHRRHRRGVLAALLWPEKPRQKALTSLRQALRSLGKALGSGQSAPDFIVITPKSVAWNADSPYEVDVAALEQHLAVVQQHDHRRPEACSLCRDRLEKAVTLYQGEFLAGLALRDSEPFEEWRLHYQERLHQQVMEVLVLLADYYEQQGDFSRALSYARRQLALEPWFEGGHRQLMRLLALGGRRGAALAQYRECREVLAAEFGAEPEEATTALYEQIRSEQTPTTVRRQPPPHNLPAQLTTFVGREAELAWLAEQLNHSTHRLLTVSGMGGTGKTRLVLRAAADNLYLFPDGVYFVPLETVQSRSGVLAAIARAMELPPLGPGGALQQLVGHLRSRQVLLVLDNLEHLVEEADLLTELLQQAPAVTILASTRQRLDCQAEVVLNLKGLDYPAGEPLEESWSAEIDERYPALRLFRERAGQARPGFQLTEEMLASAVAICRTVEGSPLAIELAAAGVREQSCTEMARLLAENLDAVSVSWRDLPPRQRSLRAVFAYSWQLLSAAQQSSYRRLAVFQGGFSPAAALAVTGTSAQRLDELAAHSLLVGPTAGRYQWHTFLQQYAAEKLLQEPEAYAALREQHSRYYLGLLRRQEDADLRGWEEVLEDLGNIELAWEWAVERAWVEEIGHSHQLLARLYDRRGLYCQGDQLFGAAAAELLNRLAAKGAADVALQRVTAQLLVAQARFLAHQPRYPEALETAQRAVRLAHGVGDENTEAQGRCCWGEVLFRQARYAAARKQLDRSLSLARRSRMRPLEAECLRLLAGLCWGQDDHPGARAYLEEALRLGRKVGDRRHELSVLNNLTSIAVEQNDYMEARRYARQSLDLAHALGVRQSEALALINLGNVHLYLGDYAVARSLYEESLRLHREIGVRLGETVVLGNLGLLYCYQGQHERAREYGQRALRLAQKIGQRSLEAFMWMHLGCALEGLQADDEAAAAYRQALELRQALGQEKRAVEAQAGLARVALAQGRFDQAAGLAAQILDHLAKASLHGTEDPLRVYWTCYLVLTAVQDPRRREVLDTAYRQL